MKTHALIFFVFSIFTLNLHAFSSKSDKKMVKDPIQKTKPQGQSLKNTNLNSSLKKVLFKHKSFSTKAVIKAFTFLDSNFEGLHPKSLCLSKDNIRNRKIIRNKKCLVIADYSKSKRVPRLLVINPLTGESELFFTAHGKGSHAKGSIDTGHMAKRFSNIEGSNMTSLGFYLTDNPYNSSKSTFGPGPRNGLKMDGLNCSNNNARKRYVVLHTADYVQPLNGDPNKMGNSAGCVTVPELRKDIIQKCSGGALVYAHREKKV